MVEGHVVSVPASPSTQQVVNFFAVPIHNSLRGEAIIYVLLTSCSCKSTCE